MSLRQAMRLPHRVLALLVIAGLLSGPVLAQTLQNSQAEASSEVTPIASAKTKTKTKTKSKTIGASTVITIVAVGDTGLNGHMARVRSNGAIRHGKLMSWDETTRQIAAEIDGDLNFMNLETVVTANNALSPVPKAYNFRTHPLGLSHLVGLGFNIISTANNHAMDFGRQGAFDTRRHLAALEPGRVLAYPGLGASWEDAGHPWPIEINGSIIAMAATGIGGRGFAKSRRRSRQRRAANGRHASGGRIGQMSYRSKRDYTEVTQHLSEVTAAYKILSVHYGIERSVKVARKDRIKFRDIAVAQNGIDLILGHHPHVARAVELVAGKVIIHSLGNFLHHGTADMRRHGMCRDYGLMAKLHLKQMPDGRLAMRAMEVLPLTMMHRAVKRLGAKEARKRVYVLNHLAQRLDDPRTSARGIRFSPQSDGSGLYCVPGSADDPGIIGTLCAGWQPAAAPDAQLKRTITRSCSREPRPSSASSSRKRRKSKRAKHKKKKDFFSNIFGL